MTNMETHSAAWNRVYHYRNQGGSNEYVAERKCPIRLRGYSELVMGRVPAKLRKAVDTAIRRGYRLSEKAKLVTLVRLVSLHNPIATVPIGYIGKTNFSIFTKDPDDLLEQLGALSAIDEKLAERDIDRRTDFNEYGYCEVYCREYIRGGGGAYSKEQPQLKSCFRHARSIVDTFMEKDAAVREQIAKWCADDNCTIRIPFDTHKEQTNES